jgi:uncharacterized protein (DUF983 family)
MRNESTNPARPAQTRTHKRCPACGQSKPLSDFYTAGDSGPSGYCQDCQRAASRLASRRRAAAMRLLIATHPEEWAGLLGLVRGPRHVGTNRPKDGGRDA